MRKKFSARAAALGMSGVLLTSALTVFFRDLAYILGIVAMAWQFLTPVMYSQDMVEEALPDSLLQLWNLNPMTPIINAYRDILYYKTTPQIDTLAAAVVLGVVILVMGEIVFVKLQKGFAEEL